MSIKKPEASSPESIARANRKRLAAEDGARAMADADRQAVEVRKNMARLRELRETKEAAVATHQVSLPVPSPRKRTKKLPR